MNRITMLEDLAEPYHQKGRHNIMKVVLTGLLAGFAEYTVFGSGFVAGVVFMFGMATINSGALSLNDETLQALADYTPYDWTNFERLKSLLNMNDRLTLKNLLDFISAERSAMNKLAFQERPGVQQILSRQPDVS